MDNLLKMKCKICGKSAQSEYCFGHKPKKKLQRTSKGLSKEIEKKMRTHEMFEFFLEIWKKRSHFSEVSGKSLGKEPLSIYFHHIFPKNKYPEYCFDEDNIVILTFEEHQMIENDMYKYDKVNKIREQLKIKYNIL